MAVTPTPLTTARAIVVAPGTSVVAVQAGGVTAAPVPDNCYTVLVTNPSTTATGLVGIGTPGTALVAGTNAQRVPSGSTLTLGIGTRQRRGTMDEAVLANSGLIYDASAAITLEITYLSLVGDPG